MTSSVISYKSELTDPFLDVIINSQCQIYIRVNSFKKKTPFDQARTDDNRSMWLLSRVGPLNKMCEHIVNIN